MLKKKDKPSIISAEDAGSTIAAKIIGMDGQIQRENLEHTKLLTGIHTHLRDMNKGKIAKTATAEDNDHFRKTFSDVIARHRSALFDMKKRLGA